MPGLVEGSGAGYRKVAQCAIVLEDNPVGDDSRLNFETFPEEISQSYATAAYREIGGNRMSQPGFASYQGGDWGAFTLKLSFMAGTTNSALQILPRDEANTTPPDLEQMLIDMERKVCWCIATAFPLERNLGVVADRIVAKVRAAGGSLSQSDAAALSGTQRSDPPMLLVVLGSWCIIRGYVTNVSWRWLPPYHPVSARPYGGEVTLNIKPQMDEIPTWNTIRNPRGVAAGFSTQVSSNPNGGEVNLGDVIADLEEKDAQRQTDNQSALGLLLESGFAVAGAVAIAAATR
jgi:hypothetical protein